MHKKAIALSLLAASVAAVATTSPPAKVTRLSPLEVHSMATQSASTVQAPVRMQMPIQAQPQYQQPVQSFGGAGAAGLVRWRSLRQSDGYPFGSYASFLTTYRGWPGEAAMRRSAERAINDSTSPSEVVSFFRMLPPTTAVGHARHAFALQALGQPGEAREAARRAWHAGVMPRDVEDRILAFFSASLGPADHDRRLETLLDNGDLVTAQRTLGFASGPRRAVYEARLALQSRAPDAMSRVAQLGSLGNGDAGLLVDRANWLRNTGQPIAARSLLAQPRVVTVRPQNVEKYYQTLVTMAKAAANDQQWSLAYQIASQLDDAYMPGTDVSAQSYGERDEYTNLAWLAGTTAFHHLGRPADAAAMFDRYARAARSPQTRAKGYYWAGRALLQAQQAQRANGYFAEAAAFPDQFYGQLAMERLGRSVPAPAAQLTMPSPAARAAFARNDLVEATRLLGQQGQREDQSAFIRALADSLKTTDERVLAADLGLQIGRPDLPVWVARQARNAGVSHYTRASFPEVTMPPAYSHMKTISHAIMRQESSFDRTAMSPVGARGMMQLMPATARETAGKLGMSYDLSRLTSDPQYNIMLGSRYFQDLMNSFGNYAPLAVAAYNAGPGNVRKWIRERGDPSMPHVDVLRWVEEIPFFETRNYVHRVLENAVVYDTMDPARSGSPPHNRLSHYLGKRDPG
ncbi:MAG TPA: lytic transglycosylase domain-containing protein [Allosphingosinicella sp.]|nr:lytic transglycosylase domain-containing protein [Allosphingosinicella sp.]